MVDWKRFLDVVVGLTNQGYRELSLRYDGYGDSGYIEEVELIHKDGNELAGEEINQIEPGLHDFLQDVGYTILGSYFGGWEINEGSFGRIVVDLEEALLVCDHKVREEFTEEIDLADIPETTDLVQEVVKEVDEIIGKDSYEVTVQLGEYWGYDEPDTDEKKLEKHFWKGGILDARLGELQSIVLNSVDPSSKCNDAEFEEAYELTFTKDNSTGGNIKVTMSCYGRGWTQGGFEREIAEIVKEV